MTIRPGQKLPDVADELDGVVKSAVLLLLLDLLHHALLQPSRQLTVPVL